MLLAEVSTMLSSLILDKSMNGMKLFQAIKGKLLPAYIQLQYQHVQV